MYGLALKLFMKQLKYSRHFMESRNYQDENDKYSPWSSDIAGPIIKKINILKCMLTAFENIEYWDKYYSETES